MPGLIRGVARTAVIAGTATAVSNRVSRRQAERWSAESLQPQYEEPPAAVQQDTLEQLKQLGELHTSGVLTDAEFEAQKAKILAG
jgi:hypothetical protein